MPEELRPVTLYLNMEIWEYEDRGIGYSIQSQLDDEPDPKDVSQLVNEISQMLLGSAYEESPVIFTVNLQEDGQSHIDWDKEEDFDGLSQWLWLKTQLNRAAYIGATRGNQPSRINWMSWIWTLEWLIMRLRNKFKPRRGLALRGATNQQQPATTLLSEQSDSLEKSSLPPISNVIPLRRPDK